MRLSYYTIDDFRLGYDPRGVTGWRLSQFLDWRDALEHYWNLSSSKVKEFGLSNGVQVLQLVRCLPLIPGDRTGHDVLLTGGLSQPLWREEPQTVDVARTVVSQLDVRYCLDREEIIPAPKPLKEHLENIRLLGGDASAVRQICVAGVGWLTPEEMELQYGSAGRTQRYPLVMKYLVDIVAEDGCPRPQEITPWAYRRLERRAKHSARQNKN